MFTTVSFVILIGRKKSLYPWIIPPRELYGGRFHSISMAVLLMTTTWKFDGALVGAVGLIAE